MALCPLGCGELFYQTHFEECLNVEVFCPQGCNTKLRRRQLTQHYAVCPGVLVPQTPPPAYAPLPGYSPSPRQARHASPAPRQRAAAQQAQQLADDDPNSQLDADPMVPLITGSNINAAGLTAIASMQNLKLAAEQVYQRFLAFAVTVPALDAVVQPVERLRQSDAGIFLGGVALVLLLLLWFLSPLILFLLKVSVLLWVLYSSWFVISASPFSQDPNTRPVALILFVFLALYLAIMLV